MKFHKIKAFYQELVLSNCPQDSLQSSSKFYKNANDTVSLSTVGDLNVKHCIPEVLLFVLANRRQDLTNAQERSLRTGSEHILQGMNALAILHSVQFLH